MQPYLPNSPARRRYSVRDVGLRHPQGTMEVKDVVVRVQLIANILVSPHAVTREAFCFCGPGRLMRIARGRA